MVSTSTLHKRHNLGRRSHRGARSRRCGARPSTFSSLYWFEPIVVPTDGPPSPAPDHSLARGPRARRAAFPSLEATYDNYASKPSLDALSPAPRAHVELGSDALELLAPRLNRARVEVVAGIGHFGPLEDTVAASVGQALGVERASEPHAAP